MNVKELRKLLERVPDNLEVRLDLDDYLKVTGVKLGTEYDGPEEFTPPPDCILLTVE